MPVAEALLPRFRAAHTQVLGVSVDSVYSHANWGADLGGVSFPLLADFEPKGGMAGSYGVYLAAPGITDRATVIVDSSGVVRYAKSVSPAGERNIEELAAECETVDRGYSGAVREPAPGGALASDAVLYVKSQCGFSRAADLARRNLHLKEALILKNVSQDQAALEELEAASGQQQAPCLAAGGELLLESDAIIRRLVELAAPLG